MSDLLPVSFERVDRQGFDRYIDLDEAGCAEVYEMSPRPPKLLEIFADDIRIGMGLEAIVWRKSVRLLDDPPRRALLRGWSLVPVGLPP